MDRGSEAFDASMERRADGVVVAFRGELDIASVPRAEAELQRAEAQLEGDSPLLVLDLRALEFMDSTGLRFILGARTRAKEAGRNLVVVQGPEHVDRVFRVTRVDSLLTIVRDPAEVLAA